MIFWASACWRVAAVCTQPTTTPRPPRWRSRWLAPGKRTSSSACARAATSRARVPLWSPLPRRPACASSACAQRAAGPQGRCRGGIRRRNPAAERAYALQHRGLQSGLHRPDQGFPGDRHRRFAYDKIQSEFALEQRKLDAGKAAVLSPIDGEKARIQVGVSEGSLQALRLASTPTTSPTTPSWSA